MQDFSKFVGADALILAVLQKMFQDNVPDLFVVEFCNLSVHQEIIQLLFGKRIQKGALVSFDNLVGVKLLL